MKTVLLLRHAKSSWDQPGLRDVLRPLAPRGRKAAPLVGEYMADRGINPDLVLCSTARRAVETWDLVSECLPHGIPLQVREDLYDASSASLLALIRELPPSVKSVLLVGHNPTFEDLALALVRTGPPHALDELDRKYPTGALAILDFRVDDWGQVAEGSGNLRDFVRPRRLKSP